MLHLKELEVDELFRVAGDPKKEVFRVLEQNSGSVSVVPVGHTTTTKKFVDRWGEEKTIVSKNRKPTTFSRTTEVHRCPAPRTEEE